MPQPVDRAAIAADLERAGIDFQHLIEMADDDEWIKPTNGTTKVASMTEIDRGADTPGVELERCRHE